MLAEIQPDAKPGCRANVATASSICGSWQPTPPAVSASSELVRPVFYSVFSDLLSP